MVHLWLLYHLLGIMLCVPLLLGQVVDPVRGHHRQRPLHQVTGLEGVPLLALQDDETSPHARHMHVRRR